MSNRATKLVWVLFIYFLTSISFTAMVRGETATSDTCLANPKAETPPGSHWRYRTDHANKRTCWYLRQDGEQSQAAPQNVAPAQLPQVAKPQPEKPSIADARAELRGRPGDNSPAVGAPTPAPAQNSRPVTASVWDTVPTTTAAVATRAPEAPAASSTSPGQTATADSANPTVPSAQPPQAPAPTAASAYAFMPARLDTISTLIAATLGALSFAAAAAIVAKRRRPRRPRRARPARGPIWQTTDDDRIVVSDHPYSGNQDYQPRFARSARGVAPSNRNVAASKDRAKEAIPRRARPAPR